MGELEYGYTYSTLYGTPSLANTYTTPGVTPGAGIPTTALGAGIGTGIQVVGAIFSAMQAQKVGAYNQQVAQSNAQQDAFAAINSAQQHERLASMLDDELAYSASVAAFNEKELARILGQQEAVTETRLAASGLALTGSPVAQMEEQARQGSVQQALLRMRSQLEQRAIREQQRQELYAATVARFGAAQRIRLG